MVVAWGLGMSCMRKGRLLVVSDGYLCDSVFVRYMLCDVTKSL